MNSSFCQHKIQLLVGLENGLKAILVFSFASLDIYYLTFINLIIYSYALFPDALHSYMGLCGLSMMNLYNLSSITPTLNITARACKHMFQLHQKWNEEQHLVSTTPNIRNMGFQFGNIFLAVAVGVGAVFLPWIYSNFFRQH